MDKFICTKCQFLLSITKISNITTKKISTPIEFISATKSEEVIEYDIVLERNDLNTYLSKNTKIKIDDKTKLLEQYDKMRTYKKTISKYIIKCTSCGETYVLHPETIIDSLNFGKQQILFNDDDIGIKIHDPTLPRTKDYICPNSTCETNIKNFNINNKEAIFYRASGSFHMKYACLVCKGKSWRI